MGEFCPAAGIPSCDTNATGLEDGTAPEIMSPKPISKDNTCFSKSMTRGDRGMMKINVMSFEHCFVNMV